MESRQSDNASCNIEISSATVTRPRRYNDDLNLRNLRQNQPFHTYGVYGCKK